MESSAIIAEKPSDASEIVRELAERLGASGITVQPARDGIIRRWS